MTEAMLQADHVVIPPVALPTESPIKALKVVKSPAANPPVAQKKIVSEEPRDAIDGDMVNPFEVEKQKDLGLLALLFEGKEKWEGREEDFDGLEDLVMEDKSLNIPKETDLLEELASTVPPDTLESDSDEGSQSRESSPSLTPSLPAIKPTTRLKDLFASRTTGEKDTRSFTWSNALP
jgi:hypothetical protein